MIFTIIAEQRSGSLNLDEWFKQSLPNFEIISEPFSNSNIDTTKDDWIDTNKNCVIGLKYFPKNQYFIYPIGVSDKVICLYREDEKSQIESYVIARSTEKWRNENIYEEIIIDNYQEYSTYFHNLKIEFKKFIKEYNFKTFTYEDLYYRGKINELMEYLNIKSNIPFPIGVKYKKVKFHKKIKLI